jgi:hypothetical protein
MFSGKQETGGGGVGASGSVVGGALMGLGIDLIWHGGSIIAEEEVADLPIPHSGDVVVVGPLSAAPMRWPKIWVPEFATGAEWPWMADISS